MLLHVRPRRVCGAGVDGGIRVPLMKGLETGGKTGWFSSILWGNFDMEVGRRGGSIVSWKVSNFMFFWSDVVSFHDYSQ